MSRTVDQSLRAAVQALAEAGIPDAAADARHLLAHALGLSRDRLILIGPDPMPTEAQESLDRLLARRIAREPVARITGQRLFWGRSFAVTPDVLDPRADTETLIATALEGAAPTRLLDLGTGSGAIALTLLAEWPQARAVATDISPAALAVAARNASALDVADRLELLLSDWFTGITGRFDLILSNPPYIAADEMPGLAPEVLLHDPSMALSPGGDGLAPYCIIAAQASEYLTPEGRVMVEIGWKQGAAVKAIFASAGWRDLRLIRDMEGRDRVLSALIPVDPTELT
ncbi:MAG: peptide chain release factor N(5)-glutamine methyltransferase [Rhodobacterales bacterium]|nr:peptide chain release factor N(5)-glutamine methyltransferase [Rhodobacterales bacterium]MDX5390859.1 peptide chain release factor N(5)-glutamine methyltransferase [Rhodobacterales bacterium]MDX5490554.1 peptide chain release factor N(5)-glutamine methyltransferase [Rhodobacterales bacterium]